MQQTKKGKINNNVPMLIFCVGVSYKGGGVVSQVCRAGHVKPFTFQSWLLLWCVDLSVHGPKNESLFSCSCTTVDPQSSRQQSTFFFVFFFALLLFSFCLKPSTSSPSLPNTYPTLSAPLVLLPGVKWRHVFPCTCTERKEEK